jgi:DNA replication ATP-dependent helicase Dna2
MLTDEARKQDEDKHKHSCFLCTLDSGRACHTASLVGRIVAALERQIDGEKTAIFLLDTGTARVELHLDGQYYHGLVRELQVRKDFIGQHKLALHVYHLPQEPTTVEYNGSSRPCYQGNAYTLAIIEPDILLNITDLNQAEYCSRQYLLNRLLPSTTSPATIRGNLIHYCFKELLKAHGRGQLSYNTEPQPVEETAEAKQKEQPETTLTHLQKYLEQALQLNSIELALTNVSVETMREEVIPHLTSLAQWFEQERSTLWDTPIAHTNAEGPDGQGPEDGFASSHQVRAETFLLAPEIGLRGRLDLFWQQTGRQRLLELKTGQVSGNLPKRDHRWQVYGYHALLAVRRDSHMKRAMATLLYSGTPGSAQAFGIQPTIRELQRVNDRRNMLILNRITGIPSAPPGPGRCTKCSVLEQCQHISSLLQWQPPEPDEEAAAQWRQTRLAQENLRGTPLWSTYYHTTHLPIPSEGERTFFAHYYQLLQLEGRAGEEQQALLWKLPAAERIERGTTISGLQLQGRPKVTKDGWELTFHCANTSELREGDEILLSNGDPITGEVVTGTVMSVSAEQVTVWTRESIVNPIMLDRYDNDLVHVRTLQNLFRWQQATAHLRDLIAGHIRPRFLDVQVSPRTDFNAEQNLAVERAMQMQDYLLIHGPPGTGKTGVIAEIVKRLVQRGQRVILAAFTNQAVDNMLQRLDAEGFHDYLRLGNERSVTPTIRPHLLKELANDHTLRNVGDCKESSPQPPPTKPEYNPSPPLYEEHVRNILYNTQVVASTTATWSSDRYNTQSVLNEGDFLESNGLYFDVAIIDEAGQLTVPAILGALRFARRFILVGDEKQLPPLVLSEEAAEQGLSESLFKILKRLDDDYMNNHPLTMSACIPLRTQYRMNKWIANFSSTVFYNKQLLAHKSVANRRLVYTSAHRVPAYERLVISTALEPQFPLVFLDVRDSPNSVPSWPLSTNNTVETKQSHAEAQAIREIVAGLQARGIALQDIGIIAPFRAQVANIRRHLFSTDSAEHWQALPADAPISIDTVDRFQGGERMVIIMSFATQHELLAQSPRRDFLTNPHRLNVALTRAQRKLILVGCVPALERLPIFQRLITYCRSMHTLMPPEAEG